MRTLLNENDCIITHNFRPLEKCKDGEVVMHKNTVESIVFYQDKYDRNGNYLSTQKVSIGSHFLSRIIENIKTIESEQKEMTYDDGFSF